MKKNWFTKLFEIPNIPKNGLTHEGWKEWNTTAKKNYPVRWFLSHLPETCKYNWLTRKIGYAFYWVRAHTYHRYHILDMRSPVNEYDWGWCDRDFLILAAPMNILKEFVEKEWKGVFTLFMREFDPDYGMDEEEFTRYFTEDCRVQNEIHDIYVWWTGGRAAEHKIFDDMDMGLSVDFTKEPVVKTKDEDQWKKYMTEDERLHKKDADMLHRLIDIKDHLWT